MYQQVLRSYTISLFLCLGAVALFSCKPRNQEAVTPDQGAYTLNAPKYFGSYTIPSDNPVTKAGVKLGRNLFYEKKLSLDNSISCGSCHVQKNAFSDPNRLSAGVNGLLGKRNAMALSNLMWQKDFFWDGRAKSLEEQALMPIKDAHEMQETLENVVLKLKNDPLYPPLFQQAFGVEEITSDKIAKAIAQFERTLISGNSVYDRYLTKKYIANANEINGMNLFFTHPDASTGLRGANCGDCHSGNLTYSFDFKNNGLDTDSGMLDFGLQGFSLKSSDRGKFKIPSLRNIALTAPYMHDGRFATLEEVLDHYNEHIAQSTTLDPLIINATNEFGGTALKLTTQEKKDVITFLKMLTDTSFVTNPEFSDPFVK